MRKNYTLIKFPVNATAALTWMYHTLDLKKLFFSVQLAALFLDTFLLLALDGISLK